MSIKTKDGKRISDPATRENSTEIRGITIAVIRQRENGDKETVILDKALDSKKVKKPVMNGVISTHMEEGMIIYTEEYKEKEQKAKRETSQSVNEGPEIGE